MTVAPNWDSDSELPVLQRPDPPTQLSLLSQSMMDQEVCNNYFIILYVSLRRFDDQWHFLSQNVYFRLSMKFQSTMR